MNSPPIDPLELSAWLLADWEAITQAQMTIELFADEDVIRSAAEVVLRATAVVEASTAAFKRSPNSAKPRWRRALHHAYSNLVPLKRSEQAEQAMQEKVRGLARALRQFASLTRKHLGVNDPDAVIRAFPELFVEAGEPRDATETATISGAEGSQ